MIETYQRLVQGHNGSGSAWVAPKPQTAHMHRGREGNSYEGCIVAIPWSPNRNYTDNLYFLSVWRGAGWGIRPIILIRKEYYGTNQTK